MRKHASMILATVASLFVIAGCHLPEEEEPVISVRSVSLDRSKENMTIGGTAILYATVLPENALDKSIEFSSSDASVATVDADGVVTAVKAGTAVITVQSKAYENKKATCTVTVKDPEESNFISLKLESDGTWSFDMLPNDYVIVVEYEDE